MFSQVISRYLLAVIILCATFIDCRQPQAAFLNFPATSLSAPVVFTPLHTYYIAPPMSPPAGWGAGSDSNTGTTMLTPWETPSHAGLVCGDVILVAPATYNYTGGGVYVPFEQNFTQPTGCPSTSGGIDGTGGVYFVTLLCAGPTVTSCQINGGTDAPFWVTLGGASAGNAVSNWAIEGFSATQNTTAVNTGCFLTTTNGPNTSSTGAYILFANNIASSCSHCGFCTGYVHTTSGLDQWAVIGNIAFNAAVSNDGSGNCGSGVSIQGVNQNSASGTHQIVAGNFLYENINANGTCPPGAGNNTDGEGIVWDSIAEANYNSQVVAEYNLMWYNGSSCLLGLPGSGAGETDVAPYVWFNNTCYGNMNDPNHQAGSDLNFNQIYPTSTGSYNVFANIFENIYTHVGGTGSNAVVAVCEVQSKSGVTLSQPTVSIPGSAAANYCYSTTSTPTQSVSNNGSSTWVFGTNTLTNPGLANPSALPTTAPSCAGYVNVFACMNGAGIPAMVANSTGVGYKVPGPCAADQYWPSYLKGVITLRVTNLSPVTIIEDHTNVQSPCAM